MVVVENIVGMDKLSQPEQDIFNTEFPRLMGIRMQQRDFIDAFEENKPYFLQNLIKAKGKFDSDFEGVNAGSDSFGMTFIRPEHVGRTNWNQNVTATGWQPWLGTPTAQTQISKDALIVPVALANYSPSPLSSAIKWYDTSRIYPAWYLTPAFRFGNLSFYQLPKPISVMPSGKFNVNVKYNSTGTDNLALLGLTFAKGDYLNQETPV